MNMFDQIFDVTSNEIVEHVKIRRLRRLNNWTTYLVCRVPAPKSTEECPVVLENVPPFREEECFAKGGQHILQKVGLCFVRHGGRKKGPI